MMSTGNQVSTKLNLVKNQYEGLTPQEKNDFANNLTSQEKIDIANNLTLQEKIEIANNAGVVLNGISPKVRGALYIVVVAAFSFVMTLVAVTLTTGMFVSVPKNVKVQPELVLALFTSVVGFLAGLFVPSPGSKKQ